MMAWVQEVANSWWLWMGPMLLQVAILILAIGVIDTVFRDRLWPQLRLVLWGLVFVKLLVPPSLATSVSAASWLLPVQAIAVPAATEASTTLAPGLAQASGATWQVVLFLVWGGGVACGICIRVGQWLRVKHGFLADSEIAPTRVQLLAQRAARQLRLRRMPPVLVSETAAGPAVVGVFRPTVVVPSDLLAVLSDDDLFHVLLHEFAHVRRGDLWFAALGDTLSVLYWLQPLLRLVRLRTAALREVCCDATVVRALQNDAGAYQQTLLRSAQHLVLGQRLTPRWGNVGFWAGRSTLLLRLEQLQRGAAWGAKRRVVVAAVAVAVVVFVFPMGTRHQVTAAALPLKTQESRVSSAELVKRTAVPAVDVPQDFVSCWSVRAAVYQKMAEQEARNEARNERNETRRLGSGMLRRPAALQS
ncbi:MAG: M56 family metallopeptidase [Planctomycetota bacterium]